MRSLFLYPCSISKPGSQTGAATTIAIGDVELDSGARVVRHGHQLVNLTSVEFDLLVTRTSLATRAADSGTEIAP